jgi:hypothetical protein
MKPTKQTKPKPRVSPREKVFYRMQDACKHAHSESVILLQFLIGNQTRTRDQLLRLAYLTLLCEEVVHRLRAESPQTYDQYLALEKMVRSTIPQQGETK